MSVKSATTKDPKQVRDVAAEQTVRNGLNVVRDALKSAVDQNRTATAAVRDRIVHLRPLGLLTVAELAEAVGKDRNYIDSVWSAHGDTVKGRQTRVAVDSDGREARQAYEHLNGLANTQRSAAATESAARAERDRAVVIAYNTRILGPSAIAKEVGIDRNHVLRIARRNGIGPKHRANTSNQYTVKRKGQ